MIIQFNAVKKLKQEEISFIFTMLRKYGGMPDVSVKRHKKNKKNKADKVILDNEYPSLYDLEDPKWEDCKDERFLAYKYVMEKISG